MLKVDHCPKPGKIGSMTLDADNPFAGPSTLPYQLTPWRDVLRIRLDARNGDFLEVAGAALSKARRKEQDR